MDWFLCDNGLRHQRVNVRVLNPVKIYTVWNIVISPNFLVGKIFGKAQFWQKALCLSANFPHQEIRWNYGVLRSIRWYSSSSSLELTADWCRVVSFHHFHDSNKVIRLMSLVSHLFKFFFVDFELVNIFLVNVFRFKPNFGLLPTFSVIVILCTA